SEALLDRIRRLGYDLSRPHLVFVLSPRDVATNGVGPSRVQQRFMDVVRRRLVLADPAALLREREGSVQVLMPCLPEVNAFDANATLQWVERLRRRAAGSARTR